MSRRSHFNSAKRRIWKEFVQMSPDFTFCNLLSAPCYSTFSESIRTPTAILRKIHVHLTRFTCISTRTHRLRCQRTFSKQPVRTASKHADVFDRWKSTNPFLSVAVHLTPRTPTAARGTLLHFDPEKGLRDFGAREVTFFLAKLHVEDIVRN